MTEMEVDKIDEIEPEVVIELDKLIILAQQAYLYQSELGDAKELKNAIMHEIVQNNMAPFYESICDLLGWEKDTKLLQEMKQRNETALKELDAKKQDAKDNLGEMEVRDASLEYVNFYHRLGDKTSSLKAIEEFFTEHQKLMSKTQQLDIAFQKIRLGLVFDDQDLVKDNISKATEILGKESDWERRNRLKVYEGLFCVATRQWKKAIDLFTEGIATFSSYELMSFNQFVSYVLFVSLVTLSRADLKTKVLDNPEILSVMTEIKALPELLDAVYNCRYGEFFDALNKVCEEARHNMFLHSHVNYYYREVRVLTFKQYLSSYRSVAIQNMAQDFNLTPDLLDRQLNTFIASNRLNCKIDKVAGQIITTKYDLNNTSYQSIIEKGDLLLNRLTKVSRLAGA